MRNLIAILFFLSLISCNPGGINNGKDVITVSIPPFKYFVEAIAGSDFDINVMVPAGADPHIYEPVPGQISSLRKSVAYISNGYLGFEMTWLDRFYETNPNLRKLMLGKDIDLIKSEEHSDNGHAEGADPHFWNSPKDALLIAANIKTLLCELKPQNCAKYEENYTKLSGVISGIDSLAKAQLSEFKGRSFMIFHPALNYFAREYGLNQLSVESEGKEPPPAKMKNLIDKAREEKIKVIFVQKGFDLKNANAIGAEIGAEVRIVDPLAEDWPASMKEIIMLVHESFAEIKR